MIVEFSIVPIGEGESLSAYVAETFGIIEKCGLPHEFHSMGTNLEGDWDTVMSVIKSCRDRMLERTNRVSISIKIDDRKAAKGRMAHKVASARAKMH
ncbi:MAG TPA: MTH1187 family thiamine-binding protein [Candidatus Heimdallarchaeota archaeon]|nr:MTH1187 family thiamine-binding protein [Candidatus Heimdallarchaeota archaeon]